MRYLPRGAEVFTTVFWFVFPTVLYGRGLKIIRRAFVCCGNGGGGCCLVKLGRCTCAPYRHGVLWWMTGMGYLHSLRARVTGTLFMHAVLWRVAGMRYLQHSAEVFLTVFQRSICCFFRQKLERLRGFRFGRALCGKSESLWCWRGWWFFLFVSRSSKFEANGWLIFGLENFYLKSYTIENAWSPGFIRKEEEVFPSRWWW